jgi:dCTP deaminase
MSFWSGETLLERLPSLITPFAATQIDCAAYRLRVGPEVFVSPTKSSGDGHTKQQLKAEEGFVIPPGQFGLLTTEEVVTVPNGALALISVRSRVKFHGLVNVSGFHVDPGYCGRLIFAVFNAGPAPVHLSRGEDCFLIWYADLDRSSDQRKIDAGFSNLPSELVNPLAGKTESMAGLSERVHAVERDHLVIKTIGAAILTAVLGYLVRDCMNRIDTTPQVLAVAKNCVILD